MALTAAEQYMLELINRARLDPLGEAARHGIDLNQGLAPGALHSNARGVLAADAILELAAIGHSQWMISTDVFSHTGVNGSNPTQRGTSAGWTGNGVGENISWRGTTGTINLETSIAQQHVDLFLSSGHRGNILGDNYREIGIAQETGLFTLNGVNYNSSMVTQNFSSVSNVYHVTGVVYQDSNADRFYSIGEGRGGVSLSAGGVTTSTTAAGGYALECATGSSVTVTGTVNGLAFSASLLIEGVNAKLDVVNGTTLYSSADIRLLTGIQNARLLGTAAIDATGSSLANNLEGNSAANLLNGAAGNDTVSGLGGNDRLYGSSGNDTVSGGDGNDAVRGGTGQDSLFGNAGRDYLYGEAGNDHLTGGTGVDYFVFAAATGADIITDFSMTEDRLRLDDAIWGGAVTTAAQVVSQHASIVAGDVVIQLGAGHIVTLDGISSLTNLAARIDLY
jgi:serralysin